MPSYRVVEAKNASVEWRPETDDDLTRIRGKRMVLRCKRHGITDDMILIEYSPSRAKYVCRQCETTPCEEHGPDYVTILRKRQVCILCEPDALIEEAEARNGTRRSAWAASPS